MINEYINITCSERNEQLLTHSGTVEVIQFVYAIYHDELSGYKYKQGIVRDAGWRGEKK